MCPGKALLSQMLDCYELVPRLKFSREGPRLSAGKDLLLAPANLRIEVLCSLVMLRPATLAYTWNKM